MIQIYALVYGMYSAICITTYVLLLKLYNVSLRLNSATVPLKQLTSIKKLFATVGCDKTAVLYTHIFFREW